MQAGLIESREESELDLGKKRGVFQGWIRRIGSATGREGFHAAEFRGRAKEKASRKLKKIKIRHAPRSDGRSFSYLSKVAPGK